MGFLSDFCFIFFRPEVVSMVLLAIGGNGTGALGGGRVLAAVELVPSCVARAVIGSSHDLEVRTRSRFSTQFRHTI